MRNAGGQTPPTEATPQPPTTPVPYAPRSPRPPRSHAVRRGPARVLVGGRPGRPTGRGPRGGVRRCPPGPPRPFHGDLLQPGDRLRGRADLFQEIDPALGELEQRLDRERRAEQCLRGPDPAAPAQVVEGVHVEVGGGLFGPLLGRGDRLVQAPAGLAASAAARAQKPSAMATMPVSTTRTGTGASAAASTAASYVPENSEDRCRETMLCAPASAISR